MTQKLQTVSFSLLTYNLLGTPFFAPDLTKRFNQIGRRINMLDVDIVCLQEISSYYHLKLLKKQMSRFPYIAYNKFIMGPHGGLVIFSKIPFEKQAYTSFVAMGTWNMYTQVQRNGVLAIKLTDVPLVILNTHLITDFEYKSKETNPYYQFVKRQVAEVASLMNTYAKKKNTVLGTGDFNITKKDPAYKKILKITGAKDVYAQFDFPTYYNDRINWRFNAQTSARIDYIFLQDLYDTISIKDTQHVFDTPYAHENATDLYLSDHIALHSKFVFKSYL